MIIIVTNCISISDSYVPVSVMIISGSFWKEWLEDVAALCRCCWTCPLLLIVLPLPWGTVGTAADEDADGADWQPTVWWESRCNRWRLILCLWCTKTATPTTIKSSVAAAPTSTPSRGVMWKGAAWPVRQSMQISSPPGSKEKTPGSIPFVPSTHTHSTFNCNWDTVE